MQILTFPDLEIWRTGLTDNPCFGQKIVMSPINFDVPKPCFLARLLRPGNAENLSSRRRWCYCLKMSAVFTRLVTIFTRNVSLIFSLTVSVAHKKADNLFSLLSLQQLVHRNFATDSLGQEQRLRQKCLLKGSIDLEKQFLFFGFRLLLMSLDKSQLRWFQTRKIRLMFPKF